MALTNIASLMYFYIEAHLSQGDNAGRFVNGQSQGEREDLRATARVLRRGRSLVYLDIEVYNMSGTIVAKGLATYKPG